MTDFPFWGATGHWSIRGNGANWDVDAAGIINDTYHQIWVRAFKPDYEGEWVLLHRDVATDLFTEASITNKNVGGADNFNSKYSILADFADGTLPDSEFKQDGEFTFRIIPYISGESRLTPDTTTRYLQWSQTSNPSITNNSVTGFVSGDVIAINDGVADSTLLSSTTPFNGLALSTHTDAWLDGTPGVADMWFAVGGRALDTGVLTGFPFSNSHDSYAHVEKTELWVRRGPKHVVIPYSASLEMNDPVSNEITLKSGKILVGNENTLDKFLIFTFTTEQPLNIVETFYNTNLTSATTSSSIYVNTIGFTKGNTRVVDLATVGVSLTDAYTGSGTTTETIVDTNEYFTYLVSVNAIGGVNVERSIYYGTRGEILSWNFNTYPSSDVQAEEFSKATFVSNIIPNPSSFKFTNLTLTQSAFRVADGALNGDSKGSNGNMKIDVPTNVIPIFKKSTTFTCFIETEITFISGHGQYFFMLGDTVSGNYISLNNANAQNTNLFFGINNVWGSHVSLGSFSSGQSQKICIVFDETNFYFHYKLSNSATMSSKTYQHNWDSLSDNSNLSLSLNRELWSFGQYYKQIVIFDRVITNSEIESIMV
jgi:hypothetical protein